jgi:hypothetical protein
MARATLSALCVIAAVSTAPARAADWEGEIAAGPAPSGATALQGRVGISFFSHATLSLRVIDFAGSAAQDGRSKAFSGWLALGELRLHTGRALGVGRLHLALAAGVGREIAVSPGPFADGAAGPVEVGRTGPAFLVSVGGALKAGEVALSIDVVACYWTRFQPAALPAGAVANGGLGAALLFGIGILP